MSYQLFFSTLYLAGSLLIFLMGFVILRENPRSAVNRATSFMLFAGALGSILGALGRLLEAQESTGSAVAYAAYVTNFAYLWEFFFPSLLYFALVFPRPIVQPARLRPIEIALYVPHLFHLTLVVFFPGTTDFSKWFDGMFTRIGPGLASEVLATLVELADVLLALLHKIHQQLFSLVNLSYAVVAVVLLGRSWKRIANPRVRDQIGIVLLGLVVCVVCYTAAKLLPVFFPYRPAGSTEAALTSAALFVASIAIAYAIVRYKFLDMRNLARRTILYGAAAIAFAFVYLVVIRQITRFSAGVFGPNVEVIEAGFIVLSVILFQPLLIGMEDFIEAVLRRRDRSDPQLLIQELSRGLAAEVDLPGIRGRVADSLKRGLLVESAELVIVIETPEGFEIDRGGEPRVAVEPDSVSAHLLEIFASSPEPVLRRDLQRFETLGTWIEPFHLMVPIAQQGKVSGLLGLGPKVTGGRFHAEDMALLGFLAQQIATSLENIRLVTENIEKRVLEEEINMASEIQRGLLPTLFPVRPGYQTHAMSLASKLVGGDYFDLFDLDGRQLHLAIADVSGKGVPAALLMSYLRAALRSNVMHVASPGKVLARINDLLYESTSPEKFATFFYGTLDTERHELVYSNGGHNYPILVRTDGTWVELTTGGLLLGVRPDQDYEDGRIPIRPGETLFLYTDGITEATNGDDEEFGTERLVELLCRQVADKPSALVEAVLQEVRRFTVHSDPGDDLTMLVVRREPEVGVHGAGT